MKKLKIFIPICFLFTVLVFITNPSIVKANDEIIAGERYLIIPKCAPNSVVEIYGSRKKAGDNVILYKFHTRLNAQWVFEIDKDGYYNIKNVNSGLYLDVENATEASETNVQQWTKNDSKAQQWKIETTEDGYYKIISRCGEFVLDVYKGYAADDTTNIWIYNDNGTDAQKFRIVRLKNAGVAEGTYNITPFIAPDSVVEVKNGATNVEIRKNTGQDNGKWKLIIDKDGYCLFQNVWSGRFLDVSKSSAAMGPNGKYWYNIQNWDGNNTDYQRWEIKKAGNNKFYIYSKSVGLNMDLNDWQTKDGTNILAYEPHGRDNQKFVFNTPKAKQTTEWIWPVPGSYQINSLDYYSGGGIHNQGQCLDIGNNGYKGKNRLAVISSTSGVVTNVKTGYADRNANDGSWGNYVQVKYNNYYIIYAHLKSVSVKKGATIKQGTKIGVMGTSGGSTGVHLHMQVYPVNKKSSSTDVYVFDLFKDNANYNKNFKFLNGLQNKSKRYGSWIKKNYTKKSGNYLSK